ncbi:hypothetical protein [uncultured Pseudokineococcus sp.]|uniref:hypothetical protein n=1 Tax=uncultured Pseudokineococcus sp. TaxID=1642928 RepID=UPI002616FE83|nr:hypothetical protein [uncultured Pseudokineococcus sp.]
MSAATSARPAEPRGGRAVTFGRVVRSERIKLLTLRSTWWALALTLLAVVAVPVIPAALYAADPASLGGALGPDVGALTAGTAVAVITLGVLGVLAVTSEYSSGMVRATMTAVPRRTPVLLAKGVVLAVLAALVGVVGVLLAWVVTLPLYGDAAPSLATATAWRVVLGSGLRLAGVALLALAVGALLRSAAGAVAVVLGLLLVLPGVLQVAGFALGVEAFVRVVPFLPGQAGAVVTQVAPTGDPLGPWTGLLVMAAWIAVLGGAAVALLRSRDV